MIKTITFFLILLSASFAFAQQQKYRQTDPKDIATRQQIDRDLQNQIWLLDREIQADTTVLTAGQTADTIDLEHKYEDLGYTILLLYRRQAGDIDSLSPYCYPITDSSFVIDGKNSNDSSTVQWMTIHKGE